MFLKSPNVVFIPGLTNIRCIFLVQPDGSLLRHGNAFTLQNVYHPLKTCFRFLICLAQVFQVLRYPQVCDDLDNLEEVVESDHSIEKHKEALRNLKNILHIVSFSLWLEVLHAVITNISNGPSSQRRKLDRWNCCDSALRKLLLQYRQGICLFAMARSCLENFTRVWMEALLSVQPREFPADEPVPTKLYLPMVSVVAALSNKNESLDFELYTLQH